MQLPLPLSYSRVFQDKNWHLFDMLSSDSKTAAGWQWRRKDSTFHDACAMCCSSIIKRATAALLPGEKSMRDNSEASELVFRRDLFSHCRKRAVATRVHRFLWASRRALWRSNQWMREHLKQWNENWWPRAALSRNRRYPRIAETSYSIFKIVCSEIKFSVIIHTMETLCWNKLGFDQSVYSPHSLRTMLVLDFERQVLLAWHREVDQQSLMTPRATVVEKPTELCASIVSFAHQPADVGR